MPFSNLTAYFIILSTALTLHVAGIRDIKTADFAFLLFAMGILGTGLFGVPVLAGSGAYALSEAMGWRWGLERKATDAVGFYGVITLSVLAALVPQFSPINPVKALFSQVAPRSRTCDVGGDVVSQVNQSVPSDCGSPMQVVADALHYFGQHFHDSIQMPSMAQALGISLDCLNFSFEHIRGVTPMQALQEHRLNKLFVALTDQPRQGLGRAIHVCGLAETTGVLALFEQEFGIDMPLFLLTCRRAADDRLFRLEHPEAEALVLPT